MITDLKTEYLQKDENPERIVTARLDDKLYKSFEMARHKDKRTRSSALRVAAEKWANEVLNQAS
jgi:metal-responsive CopG/Arc/MetJ family transcriptional regulator